MDRGESASQMEPVLGGNIAFRNGDKTRKPRFRSKQIVIVGIQISFRAAITDGQQLTLGIEQEAKLHRVE